MFGSLSEKFVTIISSLKGRAIITEQDLDNTLREVRIALLEADVALVVVKDFISRIKEKIIGQGVLKTVKPDQMIIKLVHDQLINILGNSGVTINLKSKPPGVIIFCGLQGSGKTTSIAKIAKVLKIKNNKKILLASTDIYRPAAQEQLEILGNQIQIDFIKSSNLTSVKDIVTNAMTKAKKEYYDLLMIDTAGRQIVDLSMMDELKMISELCDPVEKILVADSLTGQDAANIAKKFNENIGITGIILTRIDGDGRGGAALSIKSITGAPIKYLGTGEKIDQIEEFHPDRIAKRILGMGDIVSLVEKASENIEKEELNKLSKKISQGSFDLEDFSQQLKQMKNMGGVSGILSMLPGISKAQKLMAENNIDEKIILKQLAIISSMTKKERTNPEMIKASRKIRISNGSGTKVQDVNRLLKQFFNSQRMMKRMKKHGGGNISDMPSDLINKIKGNLPTNLNK